LVFAGAHAITVSPADKPPALTDPPHEDLRLFGAPFLLPDGTAMRADQRRKRMAEPRARQGLQFTTQHVWTFHFWQHLLDIANFELDLTLAQFSLAQHLDGQPLAMMGKSRSRDQYLWALESWHEDILDQRS
jgi:hypothetical protein